MPKSTDIRHVIFFDTAEDRRVFQAALHHLKYKTGYNFGDIMIRALHEYNLTIGGYDNGTTAN